MTWRSTEFYGGMGDTLHLHRYRAPSSFGWFEHHVEYTHDHPGGEDAHTHDVSDLLDKLVKRWGAA